MIQPDGPPPVLSAAAVRVRLGARTVLDGLDLALRPGEIYALLGPNGAGKTTLIRTVCGRLRADAGALSVAGGDPWRDAAARRAIGLVPQNVALYPALTPRENLAVFARLAHAAPDAVVRALALTGMTDRADDRVATLSGGMQRRINIAAAILHAPKLLVLDEPTVGVDLDARAAIHAVVAALRDEGIAVLLATHDLDQAAALADRVGFLFAGRIAPEGRPGDLLAAAFGGAKAARVVLAAEPGERQGAALRAAGLAPTRRPTDWIGALARGYDDVPALSAALAAGGVAVREVIVREPDLHSLFLRLAGEDLAA
ncbi:MAG: ABC transporter ATP-binding protein [Rhodospirillales bacterium]